MVTPTQRKKSHIESLKNLLNFRGSFSQLKELEKYAHKFAEDKCNFPVSEAEIYRRERHIKDRIKELFNGTPKGFFINGDPRGYALKIEADSFVDENLSRDWGRFIILAPSDDNFN